MEKLAVVVMVEVVRQHCSKREISCILHAFSNKILFSEYYLSVVKVSLSFVIYVYSYIHICVYVDIYWIHQCSVFKHYT